MPSGARTEQGPRTPCPPRGPAGRGTNPSQRLGVPAVGSTKCLAELGVFSEPQCREPWRGCAWHRHAAGQVEVLPRECQELFLGKPWLLLSGMGGKEPLT